MTRRVALAVRAAALPAVARCRAARAGAPRALGAWQARQQALVRQAWAAHRAMAERLPRVAPLAAHQRAVLLERLLVAPVALREARRHRAPPARPPAAVAEQLVRAERPAVEAWLQLPAPAVELAWAELAAAAAGTSAT